MFRYLILLTCLITCSCALHKESYTDSYGYVFTETTGLTRGILIDGKKINIKFSSESDMLALKTLTSLNWPVLYASGNGSYIFIKGNLDSTIQWTPNHPSMATPEPFQEFKLISWYIKTPFKRIKFVEEWLPETYEVIYSNSLESSDFVENEFIEGLDLANFQRKQSPNK